jgi:prepilin-type N-terminal cleavage/methylation domain-containing protein
MDLPFASITPSRRLRPRGFTLIEMLVVVAVIAVLAGILVPVLGAAKTKAKIYAANADIRSLQVAIHGYKAAYGVMPGSKMAYAAFSQDQDTHDFTYGTTWPNGSLVKASYPAIVTYYNGTAPTYQTCNAELIALLKAPATAMTPELRAISAAGNPQQLDLLTVHITSNNNAPGLGSDGVFRDPWGNPYIATVDLDGDGACIDALYGRLRKRTGQPADLKVDAMVWSFGPDGKINTDPAVGPNGGENKDNITSW